MSSFGRFLLVFIALFDLTPSVLARDESKGKPIHGMINSQDAFSSYAGWSVK